MAAGDGKGGKKADGKAKGVGKRSGKKQGDGKKGGSKAEDKIDFGPPLQRRGLFATARADICPLRNLMYGSGDALPESINSSTVDVVEDIMVDYCCTLLTKAVDQAALRGSKIQAEDILFLLRKDPPKFARCKQLLSVNEEIKQARKQFEEDDAIQRR